LPGGGQGIEDAAAPPPGVGTPSSLQIEPLPAINAALKSALEARFGRPDPLGLVGRREREAIAAFYGARGFAPLWWRGGSPGVEAASVIERLRRAGEDGLDLKGFAPEFAPATEEETAAADIALTEAVVAYGRQASGSRVDPHMISRLIGAEPEVADPAVILALVSTAGEAAGDELRGFNPPQRGYLALREKLSELRSGRFADGGGTSVPAGAALRKGGRGPRLAADLSVEGRSGAGHEARSDRELTAAAALAGGETPRLEAEIIANMERWRWMPRDLGERRVEVNIPDYEAAVIDNGAVIDRTRVIVGKEQTPTPVFSETMRFLIVNPYWNVPPSILRKEMLPRAAGDPGYFRRLGYEVFSRAGHLVVRQPPGERNALGRIKFMFPNDFSVYMHDTPARRLFAAQKRAFSHGCVRVDAPFRFAETVLGRANGWSEQRVKKLIGGKERYVYLPRPLPVHIEYFTAYVDAAGALQLRGDIYGYSRRVRAALGVEG
jgi:L,D-transpeptidase YcbB